MTVTAVDHAPFANALHYSTNQNTPVTVTLSGSDIEGSALTYGIDAGPAHGTLSDVTGTTLTYYPAGNFSGTDTFTYSANDGSLSGASATVTITVNSVTQTAGVTITQSGRQHSGHRTRRLLPSTARTRPARPIRIPWC